MARKRSSWPGGSFFDAVRDGFFFDVETDFGFGRRGRRLKQRAAFLVDVTERAIVQEEEEIARAKAGPSQLLAYLIQGAYKGYTGGIQGVKHLLGRQLGPTSHPQATQIGRASCRERV